MSLWCNICSKCSSSFIKWANELWTLMTCWGKWNATWHFTPTLFCWCLSTVETLSDYTRHCSDMFIHAKTSSTEGGMILLIVHDLCTSLRCITAQTREPELIAAARVNACRVYTSTFPNRPRSGSPRRLYSDQSCHIKDCQNTTYYLNFPPKKCVRFTWIPVPLHP